MTLNPKQKQYLKGLGHALRPILQVGKDGVNERQLSSISKALQDHELIKINILENSDLSKDEATKLICEPMEAQLVQLLGKKMILFRQNKKEPKIVLPVK